MAHSDYLRSLKTFLDAHAEDPLLPQALTAAARPLAILTALDLDAARAPLEALYCPVKRRPPRDPVCLLRLLLLMLLCGVSSLTAWIAQLRATPLLAALTGFPTDQIPGIGTCYAFLDRLVNGPYHPPCAHVTRPAETLKHRHRRHLADQTAERHEYPPIYHSESAALVADLLAHADDPRPATLQTRMENLLALVGLRPSLDAGLFGARETDTDAATDDPPPPIALDVSGDGSPLDTDASPRGRPTCDCSVEDRRAHRCPHPRDYTSPTAQWCFSTGRQRYVFGDRYYHLAAHIDHHDLPLLTYVGKGNEADATLSLKAMDDLLKLLRDHQLPLAVETIAADMHHDTYAHSDYYPRKGMKTAIPLREPSQQAAQPHLARHPDLDLDPDGTPRCPGGARMMRHHYEAHKHSHCYCCPAKRFTHRHRKSVYLFFPERCPRGKNCCPDRRLAPLVLIKTSDDPRLYPEIPRDSARFRHLYAQRTTAERLNALHDRYHLDRRARNAAYGLIWLTLATICQHAVVRYLVARKAAASRRALLTQTLAAITQA